jgi:hypothetical protein
MNVAATTNAEGTEAKTETKTPEEIEAERVAAAEAEAARIAEEAAGETELVVAIGADPSLGSEEAEDDAPIDDAGTPPTPLIKELRKKARDDARRLRAIEQERDAALAKATATGVQPPAAVVVGEKPTLETCDYDSAKFETELAAWYDRKRAADEQERGRTEEQRKAQDAYTERLGAYKTGAAALKVADFDASEKVVEAGLSKVQQSILVKHAKNAALLVYALGKDAAKLKELGAIKDPVEFAVRATLLETEIKTVQRPKFKPEGRPAGGGTGSPATGANALEKARAAAERTGDYTEVNRLKREAKAAGQKT